MIELFAAVLKKINVIWRIPYFAKSSKDLIEHTAAMDNVNIFKVGQAYFAFCWAGLEIQSELMSSNT